MRDGNTVCLPIISMHRRISYCALLGMEGREERKYQPERHGGMERFGERDKSVKERGRA